MGNPLIWLSGADPEVLTRFHGDRAKYTTLGTVILVTGGLAGVSMWFALHTALRLNVLAAVPFALAWSVAIISIDRMLVVSLQRTKNRGHYALLALPRILLALLLGFVISTPITLQIFGPEIDKQIQVIHLQNSQAFYNQQAAQGIGEQITDVEGKIQHAQNIISASAQDPTLAALNKKYTADQQKAKTDYQEWQCQLYGGPGCPPGKGVLAETMQAAYNADVANETADSANIQAEAQQNNSRSKAAVVQATADLAKYNSRLKSLQAEQNAQDAAFNTKNADDTGLLIRLQALDELTTGNFNLQAARWLLFLLFATFELLPILTKIFQNLGDESAYEKGLKKVDQDRLANFKPRPDSRVAQADRMADAEQEAWEKVRPQVVIEFAAEHLRKARETIRQGADPTSSGHTQRAPRGRGGTRWERFRMPRSKTARPKATPRAPGSPGPRVTEKFLQEYKRRPGPGSLNGPIPRPEPDPAAGTGQ